MLFCHFFSDIIFYEITLDSGLLTGGSITLYIDSVFTHSLEPFPTEIRQVGWFISTTAIFF